MVHTRVIYSLMTFFIFVYTLFFYFPASWTTSSLVPLDSCLQFLSHKGFKAIQLLVDFSSSVANSLSRTFRKSKFMHKKKSLRIYT